MTTVATLHSHSLNGDGSGSPRGTMQLVVVDGPDVGRAVRLDAPRKVGTDAGCDLSLTDDRVSREHLSIAPDGAGFAVRDLGSRNGTHLEGARITEARVGSGASLKVGKSVLRVAPLAEPLEVTPSRSRRFGEMVGESLVIREVFAVLELAARSDVTVLLEGETGTGKELAARALHEASARRAGPFVALSCAAIPEGLVESELFGHVKGAFTGASAARDGAFVRASGGTLMLDELDSMPLALQARLLRVIEEARVSPVGGDEERETDVRLVAASRRDVSTLVADGAFRADLYYRLSVLRVRIPPLRERREDIAPTARAILERRGVLEPGPIAGANLDQLFAHDWPGNARELRNVIDRALVLQPDARRFDALRLRVRGSGAEDALAVRRDLPFHEAKQAVVDTFERRYLADLLAAHEGNLSAAARAAGLDRKHLRRLAVRHGLIGSE